MDIFDKTIAQPRKKLLKRRSRKRSFWRKTAWPLFQLGVMLVLIIFMVSFVASRVSKPFGVYSRENNQITALSKELNNIEKDNANLNNKIKYLKTPEGAAEAARKLGMVNKGEVILVLPAQGEEKTD